MLKLWGRSLSLLAVFFLGLTSAPMSASAEDKVVRLALSGLPPSFGHPYRNTGRPYIYTWSATFDGLTRIDQDGNLQPWLATSWQREDDLTWLVKLRDDVLFSNGMPFTSDAVLNVVTYLQSEDAIGDVSANFFSFIDSVENVDDHTVRFRTKVPRPDFPRTLPILYMVEPGHWRTLGREAFALDPVGTGPFKVDAYENNKVVLSAFKDSWTPPKLDRLEIIAMPEAGARVQALSSGSIDLVLDIGPEEAQAIEASGGKSYGWLDGSLWAINFIGGGDSPFNDIRVRRAINLAVNRDALTQVLLQGVAVAATQPASRIAFGFNPDLAEIPFDLDEAKRLLAEAGYPDGFTFAVEGVVGGGPADTLMYQLIAQDLSKIGVTMVLRSVPVAQIIRSVMQGGWKSEAFGLNYEFHPSFDVLRALETHSCWWSKPWYCDERITPVMDEARSEFDPDRALALRHEVMAFYRNEYAALFLYETPRFAASTDRLRNFAVPGYFITYSELDLD